MPSDREHFWTASSYAVVGHSSKRSFPKITYGALKKAGRTVYPVDPSAETIEGDRAYADFAALPKPPDADVLELPREETLDWIEKAAAAGIKKVWLHQNTDTPEALAAAARLGLEVCSGTCAVMYTMPGFSYHAVHRGIMKLVGKF
jgi:predicted CoA-binding protein